MAFYNYEAIKNGNERIRGKLEAISEKEARELLRRQDLLPVRLVEVGGVKSGTPAPTFKKKKPSKTRHVRSLNMREKIDFTNIMYTFSKAGLSLVESLYFIETNSESKKIQALSVEIRRHVLAGTSFSDSISKFPGIFDDIYIGLVRAGEESGELEETLRRISYLLDKQDKLKSKIISVLAYPVFVLFLAMIVTLVLITFVFPAFKDMYAQMGTDLPIITQILMAMGVYLQHNWLLIPLIIASVVFGVYFLFTWEGSRRVIDTVGIRIPIIKKFVIFSSISNFLMVMKVAFEAGITMVDSIMFANLTVRNMYIRDALKKVLINVQYGKSLSSALRVSQVIPGIVMCMISTGEETGALSEMLDQANEYVDTEIDKIIDLLSKLMEPFLFLIIGCVVLTLGLSLYLPLFKTYANL